ncbi:MAG: phosphoribosylformylglycinamidine synthase subunit PurQ [Candidatus Tenebribacter davisii]|nr:phosphoribosylformylglycinamidine synthase subunit PurQ [Candidatus Tenebribacter davisii]
MKKVKALVITGFGINCEEEMAAAYKLAEAEAEIYHLNDIFNGITSIHNFDVLNFPGGFSFGDDLGSGKVLANKMKYKKMDSGKTLLEEIKIFLNNGKFILGICNGFQFLVKMGLLPNTKGNFDQEVTLTRNNSAKYEDRWIYLKKNPNCKTPFLKDIDVMPCPVRHGEGKLIIKDKGIKTEILNQNMNAFSYCDADGNITSEYPLNPNGADLDCAALTDPSGQVLGMMPHPEAFLSLYNHPNWGQLKRQNPDISEDGAGLKIFRNIVKHVTSSINL